MREADVTSVTGNSLAPSDGAPQTYVDDINNFYNPVGQAYDIPVPSGMSSNQFDAAVIATESTYSLPAQYELWGPGDRSRRRFYSRDAIALELEMCRFQGEHVTRIATRSVAD